MRILKDSYLVQIVQVLTINLLQLFHLTFTFTVSYLKNTFHGLQQILSSKMTQPFHCSIANH